MLKNLQIEFTVNQTFECKSGQKYVAKRGAIISAQPKPYDGPMEVSDLILEDDTILKVPCAAYKFLDSDEKLVTAP